MGRTVLQTVAQKVVVTVTTTLKSGGDMSPLSHYLLFTYKVVPMGKGCVQRHMTSLKFGKSDNVSETAQERDIAAMKDK